MTVDIKVGLIRRATRPATWRDVVTETLWMILALACVFRFIPTLVQETLIGSSTGVWLSVAFGLIALTHAYDAIRIAVGLRKQKAAA